MSDMTNFLGQAPTSIGLVGHLEQQVANKAAPAITARFGHKLGGWSGVTLPGSGQNIRKLPKSLRGGNGHGMDGNGGKVGIGRPSRRNGWSYF